MSDHTTKIRETDLPRLKAYADKYGFKNRIEAITRLLDLAEAYPHLGTLPRPEDGQVVPAWDITLKAGQG